MTCVIVFLALLFCVILIVYVIFIHLIFLSLEAKKMIQYSETKDLELEKLQLAKEQPTQPKEGIVSIFVPNIIMLLSLNYHCHYVI